jgi:hypothetical protein
LLLLLLLLLLLQGRLCGWVLLQLRAPASCAPSAAVVLVTGISVILSAALRLTLRATWLCRMVATIACKCFGAATGRTCARWAAMGQGTGS